MVENGQTLAKMAKHLTRSVTAGRTNSIIIYHPSQKVPKMVENGQKLAKIAKNLTRSVPAGRPNSIVVYISSQNAIEDPFFFLSVIDLT